MPLAVLCSPSPAKEFLGPHKKAYTDQYLEKRGPRKRSSRHNCLPTSKQQQKQTEETD